MNKLLTELIEKNKVYGNKGKLASYIPALLKANKEDLGIVIVDLNGEEFSAGQSDKVFTIQSISKVISLMLAIKDNGYKKVLEKVNVEPTGEGFNSIVNLETKDTKRPYNPMINAGAIVTTSLIKGKT